MNAQLLAKLNLRKWVPVFLDSKAVEVKSAFVPPILQGSMQYYVKSPMLEAGEMEELARCESMYGIKTKLRKMTRDSLYLQTVQLVRRLEADHRKLNPAL